MNNNHTFSAKCHLFFLRIGISVSTIIFIISLFHILMYIIEAENSRKLTNELIDNVVIHTLVKENADCDNSTLDESEKSEFIEDFPIIVDFEKLKDYNRDIVAWLYFPGTKINYPIAQSNDNDYYLHRLIDRSWNAAGTIFMDYRNEIDFSDWQTIIYGHNMKNDTMFGSLLDYRDQAYYEAHPVCYLLTPAQNYKVELFAGYVVSEDSDIYSCNLMQAELDNHVYEACQNSIFKSNVEIQSNDRIVIFSTCSYEYDGARFVLEGVLKKVD